MYSTSAIETGRTVATGGALGKARSVLIFAFRHNIIDNRNPVLMPLDPAEVTNIAHLARLEIDPADIAGYARNLSDILTLVEQLNAVDTSDTPPMAHPQDTVQRLRTDHVTESNQRERFQEHAPQIENGLYLVPKVIE